MGRGGEDASGDFLHQAAHEFENHQAGGDNNKHHNNIAGGKKDKFKEIACEWNNEGGSHNTDNGEK